VNSFKINYSHIIERRHAVSKLNYSFPIKSDLSNDRSLDYSFENLKDVTVVDLYDESNKH